MSNMEKTVYIFGHKNPDTDAAVSAVAYGRLKKLLGFNNYIAARAGHFAPQTEYVFNKFNVKYPEYIPELAPKTKFFMNTNCVTVQENESLWSSIANMDKSTSKVLPVVDKDGKYKSLLHYNVFAQNMLTLMNPEKTASITTSIDLIRQTMNAQPIIIRNEFELFKASVLVGASSLESFQVMLNEHKSENIVVITSDREEIQAACIDAKIKLLIITSDFVLSKALREKAEKSGVSVIMSSYATSSTAMLIAYSTPVSVMADNQIPVVHPDDTVSKIRPLLQASPSRCLPVVNTDSKVVGLISESDLLHEANIEVILVDHNEATQSVEGLEHYRIQEVIDHHRLGNLPTKYPILFINKPVGATATIIANMYREYHISIPKDIAGILLCAILSDTLILKSATVTEIDKETARYLSDITDLEIETLGEEIIAAGSKIGGRSASEVIKQDMKEYVEGKETYTVSQIEVESTAEILGRKDEFLKELEIERRSRKSIFSALLVTDITKLSSILFIDYDKNFRPFITFPKREENIYYLKDVVSRKKQLMPIISEQVASYLR